MLVFNAVVGFFQEYRAENTMRALLDLTAPRALLRRNGNVREELAESVVPGDVVLLEEGAVVPADLRLLQVTDLRLNEASLTGESVAVRKQSQPITPEQEEQSHLAPPNMALMGTGVVSGNGRGVVVATGDRTRMGAIAAELRGARVERAPLQRRMDRLAKWLALVVMIASALAFGVGLAIGRPLAEMFLLAVALAVSAMPEGLPAVISIALAVSVRRMALRNAIVRRLPAVETLGSTTVIVSDKTGTMTENRMTVAAVVAGGESFEFAGRQLHRRARNDAGRAPVEAKEGSALYYVLLAGLLNNRARLVDEEPAAKHVANEPKATGDPMEVALLQAADSAGLEREHLRRSYPQVDEVPFSSERRFSATIHGSQAEDGAPLVLVKGAPEVVLNMAQTALDPQGRATELDVPYWSGQIHDLAAGGLRVLGVAIGRDRGAAQEIKAEQPKGLSWAGMLGLMDPPRPEARLAIASCRRAGIRVIMVTGDYAETAAAIARQLHLNQPTAPSQSTEQKPGNSAPEVYTGQRLADLSIEELDAVLDRVSVFARVAPAQKLRIVERLKARNHIVAVTGDGVNDAPALKSAHLGVAMGRVGSDVAKEASEMVLRDDNFATIYAAVEEGRIAFRNIRMATFFLVSTGLAEVMAILASLLLRIPLPLLPAQILWLNVVTNGVEDVALAFEPGDPSLNTRPPRPVREGVLSRFLLERTLLVALVQFIGTLGLFWWLWDRREADLSYARSAALTTLVVFQTVHVFNCRSENVSILRQSLWGNKFLLFGVTGSVVLHVAALHLPLTQDLLQLQPLRWHTWALILPVALSIIVVNEVHKWFCRWRIRRAAQHDAPCGGASS